MRRAPLVVVLAAVAAVVAALAAGCPPPPPPPHDAGPPPDSGVPGQPGDPCLTPDSTNDCALGLECNSLLDADAGVFGCVTPGDVDAGCFFAHDADPIDPPDDGCKNGLLCGSAGSCAIKGVLGAPCKSPNDCDSRNCGRLADGSASVCVPNDCLQGCTDNTVCKQQGQCGQTCAAPAGAGEACITAGTDACSPVTVACADGLECFQGDLASVVTCGVPGGDGSRCNLTTPQDGCDADHICDPVSSTCVQP